MGAGDPGNECEAGLSAYVQLHEAANSRPELPAGWLPTGNL